VSRKAPVFLWSSLTASVSDRCRFPPRAGRPAGWRGDTSRCCLRILLNFGPTGGQRSRFDDRERDEQRNGESAAKAGVRFRATRSPTTLQRGQTRRNRRMRGEPLPGVIQKVLRSARCATSARRLTRSPCRPPAARIARPSRACSGRGFPPGHTESLVYSHAANRPCPEGDEQPVRSTSAPQVSGASDVQLVAMIGVARLGVSRRVGAGRS